MKDIAWYKSKGFDDKTAEYFVGGRKKAVKVLPNSDFTLTITFDNGEIRLYDVKPLLKNGTVFEKLINTEDFKRVYIDDCNCIAWDIDPEIDSNQVWTNKVDISSDTCYMDSIII